MEESKQLESFLTFLREVKVQYHSAVDEENLTDLETQDILHRLELYSDNYHETARLAKSLRSVRQRRRVAKETCEITKSIVRWIDDNKQVIRSLEWLLGEVRKVEDRQSKRIYIPKLGEVRKVEDRQSKRIYIPKTDIVDESISHPRTAKVSDDNCAAG